MAHIVARSPTSILKIKEFKGLNECKDGETNIEIGELSKMENFKITSDKHMQIRPGQKTLLTLRTAWDEWSKAHTAPTSNPRFCGSWLGIISGKEYLIAAFGGLLFNLDKPTMTAKVIGEATQDDTSFFGFDNKVYMLNGHEYKSWDGGSTTQFETVEGYIPVVMFTSENVEGQDHEGPKTFPLENVNRLTNKRTIKYDTNATSSVWYLPKPIKPESVVSVRDKNGEKRFTPEGRYEIHITGGAATPPVYITYTEGDSDRSAITKMHYAELYNGATDSRVFLYGDGTNKTVYSGVRNDNGKPSADYFPDLYEAQVGGANMPITGMIRHYSRLLVFKPSETYSMNYNLQVSAVGTPVVSFFVTPVNRLYGNDAPGQIQLLENNPLTIDRNMVFQWKAVNGGNDVSADHRNANRVSDRVESTFSTFDSTKVKVFNYRQQHEYWFLHEDTALILNYENNTWYKYTGVNFKALIESEGELYGFRPDGGFAHISRLYRNDDGADINCYAATGFMDFDKDWLLKYSPMIFVSLQPESGARVTVTVETNRRSDYPEKVVSNSWATFEHADFAHWSFNTSRKPQVRRLKMKVKKATFYKIIYKSLSPTATATILGTDVQLRYSGKVK